MALGCEPVILSLRRWVEPWQPPGGAFPPDPLSSSDVQVVGPVWRQVYRLPFRSVAAWYSSSVTCRPHWGAPSVIDRWVIEPNRCHAATLSGDGGSLMVGGATASYFYGELAPK